MIEPWTGIILVMVLLAGTIHTLSRLDRRLSSNPELTRKLLHVIMGSVTITFPWVFNDVWPVITLSIIASVFISVLKVSNLKEWKPVVCARGRSSVGEICFPLAIGLLFLLSFGNPLMYVIPVSVLTFADAASALVGMRFGKRLFSTADGVKSIEGSLTFVVTAFVAALVGFLLISQLPPLEMLLAAAVVSLIAMLFEAVSWKGLDNLFIPLGTFLGLTTHVESGTIVLSQRLLILSLLAIFVLVSRKRTTLDGSAVLAVLLVCYFTMIIGGPLWAISPAILYLSYRYMLPRRFRAARSFHTVYGVIAVASVGIVWLLFANHLGRPEYIFPYTLAFAAHASIISIAHMRFTSFSKPKTFAILYAVMKAWCLLCVPLMFISPSYKMLVMIAFLAPFCIAVPTMVFYIANQDATMPFTGKTRWVKQASLAAAASLFGLAGMLL